TLAVHCVTLVALAFLHVFALFQAFHLRRQGLGAFRAKPLEGIPTRGSVCGKYRENKWSINLSNCYSSCPRFAYFSWFMPGPIFKHQREAR
ncbi:MAG TPA: hypothetical protein VFH31_15890, partial [Pyrinomonadaceae bacterium]|nr:hypothetical protein [Pyrinomonadaceae bacterium]